MALWTPSNLNATLTAWQQGGTGVSVSSWTDSSGNGNNLVQSDSDHQPALSSLNGNDTLDFTNTSLDHMDYGDLNAMDVGTGDFYCVVVIRPDTVAANRAILAKHSGADDYLLRIVSTKKIQQYIGSTSAGVATSSGHDDLVEGQTYIVVGRRNSSNQKLRLDCVERTSSGVLNANSFSNSRTFHVGGQATTGEAANFDGDISEIIMGGGAIEVEEIEQVEGYLNRRFALGIFPSTHSYSDFAPAVGLHGVHNQDLIGELALDVSGPLVSDTLAGAV